METDTPIGARDQKKMTALPPQKGQEGPGRAIKGEGKVGRVGKEGGRVKWVVGGHEGRMGMEYFSILELVAIFVAKCTSSLWYSEWLLTHVDTYPSFPMRFHFFLSVKITSSH